MYNPLMNVNVTLSVPPDRLEEFDRWWKAEGFASRSAAVVYLMAHVKWSKE